MAELKKLFKLDLTECPIQKKLKVAYENGVVEIFKYLQRKYDRAIYRVKKQ